MSNGPESQHRPEGCSADVPLRPLRATITTLSSGVEAGLFHRAAFSFVTLCCVDGSSNGLRYLYGCVWLSLLGNVKPSNSNFPLRQQICETFPKLCCECP
jgi:hypothetical protein